jgi:hypothetical protein
MKITKITKCTRVPVVHGGGTGLNKKPKKKMYSYTTNWLNVAVNRNYTHSTQVLFRISTLSNLELLWGDRLF